MAKRLTDTDKWNKPWYRKLSIKNKVVWQYFLDKCDHAGFIKIDAEIISKDIDAKINIDEINKAFIGKIFLINNDLYWIPKFIQFQYKGKLDIGNRCHKSIIDLLVYHGIEFNYENGKLVHNINHVLAPSKPLPSPYLGCKDKDKDKDKDKEIYNIDSVIEPIRGALIKEDEIHDFFITVLRPSSNVIIKWLKENTASEIIREIENFKNYIESKNKKYSNYSSAFSNWLKSPYRKKQEQTEKSWKE